jgi:HlyD family secretion protein
VLTRPVSMGQAVSGSDGFNGGTEVLTIADLNAMIINAQVNQADVPRLKAGEPVEVTVEAVADLQITGVVERVYPQATIKNNIKGYPARIVLKNVDPRVRPGMTANVKIPVASADNVTAVPIEAVFTEKNPDTSQMERFVYVQRGGTFEKRNVKVGVSDFSYAEIQEGLKAGEVVSLELPKDEREKLGQQVAGLHPGTVPAPRPQTASSSGATNTTKSVAAGSTPGSPPKSASVVGTAVAARSPGNGANAK